MLYNLHLLRVVAALGVVYFHTTSTAGLRLDWDVGSRGVDVFFVISGFIIAYIGTDAPKHFLRRRLIRVVPFYWTATLVVFGIAVIAPHLFRSTNGDVTHLASSLGFIPRENTVTGEMMPTLSLGWSLNFEMFFYVVFALALVFSPRRAPLICVGWLVAFVLGIHLLATRNDVTDFLARPIVLEFCYGILAFYVVQWASTRKDTFAKHASIKWLLAAVFVIGLVLIAVLEQEYRDGLPRYLVAGIPAFFIVVSALLLERLYQLTTKNRVVHLLGEASYIIYLVHPYIVFTVLRLLVKDSTLPAPALAVVIVFLLAMTSGIAVAIHLWFEKPLVTFLRARFAAPQARR